MERRAFGNTGMSVSVLGFGSSEIGFLGADQTDVDALLNEALDHGLNVIDTAECYMDSEEKIGKSVGHRRGEFFLFTKAGHKFAGGPDLEDWSPELLNQTLEHSLKMLKTDRVDLLQLHSCSKEVLERGEVLRFVEDAKASGKTRFIGYSGDDQAAVHAIETGLFDALQTSCNIADQQSISLLLPLAKERAMGVIAKRSVANVAWMSGDQPPERAYARDYWERLQHLKYPFLQDDPASAFEVALRFTLSQDISTMIVGTMRPGRWPQNAAVVAKGPLPPSEVKAIRDVWGAVATDDWVGLT